MDSGQWSTADGQASSQGRKTHFFFCFRFFPGFSCPPLPRLALADPSAFEVRALLNFRPFPPENIYCSLNTLVDLVNRCKQIVRKSLHAYRYRLDHWLPGFLALLHRMILTNCVSATKHNTLQNRKITMSKERVCLAYSGGLDTSCEFGIFQAMSCPRLPTPKRDTNHIRVILTCNPLSRHSCLADREGLRGCLLLRRCRAGGRFRSGPAKGSQDWRNQAGG